MKTWDEEIFTHESNETFLADIDELDSEDLIEALQDACQLSVTPTATDEEKLNGLAAATITAMWCGAPFTYSEVAEEYSFVRSHIGRCPEQLRDTAEEVFTHFEQAPETEEHSDEFAEFAEALG